MSEFLLEKISTQTNVSDILATLLSDYSADFGNWDEPHHVAVRHQIETMLLEAPISEKARWLVSGPFVIEHIVEAISNISAEEMPQWVSPTQAGEHNADGIARLYTHLQRHASDVQMAKFRHTVLEWAVEADRGLTESDAHAARINEIEAEWMKHVEDNPEQENQDMDLLTRLNNESMELQTKIAAAEVEFSGVMTAINHIYACGTPASLPEDTIVEELCEISDIAPILMTVVFSNPLLSPNAVVELVTTVADRHKWLTNAVLALRFPKILTEEHLETVANDEAAKEEEIDVVVQNIHSLSNGDAERIDELLLVLQSERVVAYLSEQRAEFIQQQATMGTANASAMDTLVVDDPNAEDEGGTVDTEGGVEQ